MEKKHTKKKPGVAPQRVSPKMVYGAHHFCPCFSESLVILFSWMIVGQ